MRNLYLATSPQIFYDIFKYQLGLFLPSLERGKIIGVFCQGLPYRFIHQFGYATVDLRSFQAQGSMEGGLKINGRPLLCGFSHLQILAS